MATQQNQSGVDFNNMSPGDIATLLGTPGYGPAYDSNRAGSFQEAYNNILNTLTPDLLLKRYGQGQASQFQATGQDQSNYQAYSTFKSLMGRAPTSGELAQIIPAFQGPNGLMNGRAFLANMQQQYHSNPTLDPGNPQNNQNPTDIQGQVKQQFQSILGRDPTTDELNHFTTAIQSNQTDAYGLSSFLKQMPEYTNTQDTNFRNSLNSQLQGYDTNEFNREKQGVMADYASRGMGGSSSLDYALTDLMGKIAQNRSSYLANLSASQYGGNKDLAIGNYQNTLNQMYGNSLNQRQSQQNYSNDLLNRGFQGADYQTQRNDFMNFMNNNRGSSYNPLYGVIGGAIGAGAGGLMSGGNPGAINAGSNFGSGLFSYLGNQ